MALTHSQLQTAVTYFQSVQSQLVDAFEKIDGQGKFERKSWQRPEGGGGTMAVLRGQTVEKAGANFSQVEGDKYPAVEGEYAGKPFVATGVSTICHMQNPHAPIGHMNLRLIKVGEDFWFGGGADLTPCKVYDEDTKAFHSALKKACDTLRPDAYAEYTKWCKEYFHIKHRNSERGVGGVFFDYLKGGFDEIFPFVKAVGQAYVEVYPSILQKRKDQSYTPEEKVEQEHWRGRYVEFNLLYDRGTKFGLMTGGNLEAIFVSLPPVARW